MRVVRALPFVTSQSAYCSCTGTVAAVPPHVDEMDAQLRVLIDASAAMHPDEVVTRIREVAERTGGSDFELLVADLSQRTLSPLPPAVGGAVRAVSSSYAGAAYRRTVTVSEPDGGGTRLWVPMLDSAERVGVLGVTVPAGDVDVPAWESLAALAAELLVASPAMATTSRWPAGHGRPAWPPRCAGRCCRR